MAFITIQYNVLYCPLGKFALAAYIETQVDYTVHYSTQLLYSQ